MPCEECDTVYLTSKLANKVAKLLMFSRAISLVIICWKLKLSVIFLCGLHLKRLLLQMKATDEDDGMLKFLTNKNSADSCEKIINNQHRES